MDSNKVRKNQNQTTCILKACDYLIDLSIHISNFKNIAKPPQTSILNAHWQSVTLVSMKTLDTPLVQSPSLLQLSPLGETGCTHDLHCDTSEFATFLEKVGMLTSWWCVVISVFLFLRLFPLRTHTPWRWQESICCHCPNHCVILQKRFRICKDRLFSASCLKDARIWNEALGNNFKEAHVFCFHFFPLQSHMKTYPEAPLEQVLLLNPIAGAIIHIRWMDFEKFPRHKTIVWLILFPRLYWRLDTSIALRLLGARWRVFAWSCYGTLDLVTLCNHICP